MPMSLIGSGQPDDPLTKAAFGHAEKPQAAKPKPKKAKAKKR